MFFDSAIGVLTIRVRSVRDSAVKYSKVKLYSRRRVSDRRTCFIQSRIVLIDIGWTASW